MSAFRASGRTRNLDRGGKIRSKKLILKKLININNKISKQQYAESFVMLYSNQPGNSLNHTGLNRRFVLPN